MAIIGTRLFNLIEDKYLTLGNEEYLRPLSIGNNWSKLRLGLMLALPPNGTSSLRGSSIKTWVRRRRVTTRPIRRRLSAASRKPCWRSPARWSKR